MGIGRERTYEAMAPVYDDFTAHHDYEGWIADLWSRSWSATG